MSDSIGFLLVDTARLFRRAFDARTRDTGVTSLQWRIIYRLDREPGLRQAPLAELLEVEPITLSRMIDRLADAGLVERRADPADRRAWQLFLTDKAEPIMAELRRQSELTMAETFEGLDEAERTQLAGLLERIRCNLTRKELVDA